MAEMQQKAIQNSHRAGVARSKKLSTRVDLTPMVDLGFLLITFFIFTTSLAEPRALKLYLPADGPPTKVGESTSLSLIPISNNEIIYFHGSLEEAIKNGNIGKTGFQPNEGIGDLIRQKRSALTAMHRLKDMLIQIYPDASASYKNIVDLLDEMLINAVPVYSISDNLPTIDLAKKQFNAEL